MENIEDKMEHKYVRLTSTIDVIVNSIISEEEKINFFNILMLEAENRLDQMYDEIPDINCWW